MKSIKTFFLVLFLCTSITTLYAQWVEKSNGIYGANVRAIVSDGLNLYAGTTNGVYRSSDNGVTWTTANAGIENTHVYALVIFGGHLYAGVSEDASAPFGGGVYISTDSGVTWTAMNTGLTNLNVYALAVSGGNLFAATVGGGVFLSINAGASWSSINTGITNLNIKKLLVVGTNLFAGAFGSLGVSLFRSSDNGSSWTDISPSGNSVHSLIENAGNLFVGGSGIFRSSDNGATWTPVNTGLPPSSVYALEKIGSNLFAGTDNGMFMSTDNGSNWTVINNGITNNLILSLATAGGNLYAGAFGSIFLSTNNGANWTSVNTGLANTLPNQLEISGGNLFALSNGGIHRSTDNGTNWTALNTGLTNTNVYALKSIAGNLFAGTDGGVFLSTDNGLNWSAVNTGLMDTRIRTLVVSGANLFAGTQGGGVFLSSNNGTNWTAANNGLVNFNSRSIFELASSGGTLFAGTFDGCYKSTDNGGSWVAASTGLTNTQVQSLTVSGTNLFAGTQGGVFLSTNNGTNWTAVNNGLTSFSNRWIWKLTAVGTNVFAGTDDGIFLSTDNGANWSNVGIGLPDTNVRSLSMQDENVFAGIAGRNVWSRPLSEFGIFPPPTITFFTPISGPIGTTVTITGTNFDLVPANNIVSFNGIIADTPTGVTATSLTVVVPTGATTGPITVTVGGNTATSTNIFMLPYVPSGNVITTNGTTDLVQVSDNTALQPQSFTLETWVNFASIASTVVIAGKPWLQPSVSNSFAIYQGAGNLLSVINNTPISAPWIPTVGEWNHIALTYDNSTQTQTLYLNGVIMASSFTPSPIQYSAGNLSIGSDIDFGNPSGFFNGKIDEVRFWEVARTQGEIQSTINSTLAGNETGLVAYYKMDEVGQGAGITVVNSATATGATLNGTTFGTACTPIFTLTPPPATPGAISGTTTICSGSANTYGIEVVNGATSYTWTLPGGWTGTSTTNTITATASSTSGNITVTANNACGTSAAASQAIVVNTVPATPGAISGTTTICSGSANTYSIAVVSGATSYTWTLPGGWTGTSTTNTITATASSTSGNITVTASNECGTSAASVHAIVVNTTPAAPTISPVNPVCPGSNVTLTATGGTDGNYRWYENSSLLTDEVNSVLSVSNLASNKTFQVSIDDGTCESNKTSVTVTVQNCTPPTVASTTATAFIEGLVTIDLTELITDPEDNIDVITITEQPVSGAIATINGFELVIDYSGFPFIGSDRVGIEACDLTALCTTQQLTIELGGEINVYNAVSPNNDGKNEFLTIQYIDILPETQNNQVFIYNRWGDEVFSAKNYNNSTKVFKGENNNGNKLPSGTYFYKIVFTPGKARTGFLELKY